MIETSNARSLANRVELKIVTQKTHSFTSHLKPILPSYRDGTRATISTRVTHTLWHQKIKDSTNYQRIEKRDFGAIP